MNTFEYSSAIPVMEPTVCLEPENMQYVFRPYKIQKTYNFPSIQRRTQQQQRPICNINYSKIVENNFGHQLHPQILQQHIQQQNPNHCYNETKGSTQNTQQLNRGEWNKEEHDLFMKGYKKYEKNWAMIAKDYVKTRTRQQVRNHAVKFFIKEEKAGRKIQF